MHSRSIFLSLLPLCFLICRQTPNQNSVHAKEWAERRARYLAEPKIHETDSWLEITANDPRPLDNVVGALVHQHGWHINYEDPQYGKADLVDNTAPSWLQGHPNGPRAYVVTGGAFYAKIAIDGYIPDDPMQILPPLVEGYDRSGNPGRFELRRVNHGSFDIVPTGAADGPQTPRLDTVMSFDATDAVSAPVTLRRLCEELSRQSGQAVVFGGTGLPMESRFDQARIVQHSQNQPAREIIRQMYNQVSSTDCWRLLYDPDSNKFWLWVRW
jgi:hypothetical protein